MRIFFLLSALCALLVCGCHSSAPGWKYQITQVQQESVPGKELFTFDLELPPGTRFSLCARNRQGELVFTSPEIATKNGKETICLLISEELPFDVTLQSSSSPEYHFQADHELVGTLQRSSGVDPCMLKNNGVLRGFNNVTFVEPQDGSISSACPEVFSAVFELRVAPDPRLPVPPKSSSWADFYFSYSPQTQSCLAEFTAFNQQEGQERLTYGRIEMTEPDRSYLTIYYQENGQIVEKTYVDLPEYMEELRLSLQNHTPYPPFSPDGSKREILFAAESSFTKASDQVTAKIAICDLQAEFYSATTAPLSANAGWLEEQIGQTWTSMPATITSKVE